jgi:hypothetical protein
MPKFVIERRYLLPIYQRLIIEAPSDEVAFEAAIGGDYGWSDAEEDGDGALPTMITAAKIAPVDRDEELTQAESRGLGAFLFENDVQNGPLLTIPLRYRAT